MTNPVEPVRAEAREPRPSAGPASSPLASVLSRLVAYMLPVVFFLVTVSFYLKTYDSAQIKITITQVGCTAVMLFWLAQLLLERRWPFTKSDIPIAGPIVAFLGSGILSFAQSSFKPGSVDEFLRRVLYCFMGLIVVADFKGWDRHRRLLRWLLAAFGVVVFYGFVQYFDERLFPPGQGIGLDPFVWRWAFGARPFSTFGNPNFYGNFLVIITPIVLAIYLRSGGQIFRPYLLTAVLVAMLYCMDRLLIGYYGGVNAANQMWIQGAVFASLAAVLALIWWRSPTAGASGMLLFYGAMFMNLVATETKGAWMGFLAALIATTVLVGLFFTGENARAVIRKLFIVVLITAVIGGGFVVLFARRRFQSVSFRVFTWIATWEMVREQPILGSGIGTFKWAYPAHRRPEIILVEAKSNTETDHSEDEYLEVWQDEGIIGFGIFLWMILTASVLGVRALAALMREARGPPRRGMSERAYDLLAYLGAYWGGLIHWFVDVSVRFVSSGIYSVLLPGVVTSLVRNYKMPYRQDAPSPSDRWIRAGVMAFWVAVFLNLEINPLSVIVSGVLLWLLGESLELRLTPETGVAAAWETEAPDAISGASLESDLRRQPPLRLLAVAALIAAWGYGYFQFRNFFRADVNHNLAIFFSKQGVWSKQPEFDAMVAGFPPEMQKEYNEVGGALEHYHKVVRLNPFFPMARYFIGNVYNDWGSAILNKAQEARSRGDAEGAEKLRARAEETWVKAMDTYGKLKEFAPNYVQTHHQIGLLYLKLGDMEKGWGNQKKGEGYWDLALKNFQLYRYLDPVFPPNYYRTAYIYYSRGQYDLAEKTYLEALKFNADNIVKRIYSDRNAETYISLGRMFYIMLINKSGNAATLRSDLPEFEKARKYYQSAVDEAVKAGPDGERWKFDAMKGLAILYSRADKRAEAIDLWQRLRAMRPDDADVQSVFRGPAPAK